MTDVEDVIFEITPDLLLKAYACGVFPMSQSADDPDIFWVEPEMRGVLPLDAFHVPRSLKKALRKADCTFTIDKDFQSTIAACAEATPRRRNTWINAQITELYTELHQMGHAHSFEVWEGPMLIGGLYGVRLGRAFFGESMFSRKTNGSKFALVHLVTEMRLNGFTLLDTQFTTDHLAKFGVIEVPKHEYQQMLEEALVDEAHFPINQAGGATSDSILQLLSQIS